MMRCTSVWSFLVLTLAPAIALANPNTESPEPGFWLFVLMGAAPVAYVAWRHARLQARQIPVER